MSRMSFETKGQEFMGKVGAMAMLAAVYVTVGLGVVWLIHWLGPNMQKPCVCECLGDRR